MHKLHDLKEMLCEELEEYGDKGKLDVGSLEVVDKLAHAIKNIDKILESYDDEGYSGDYRMRGGSYAPRRRDRMGRYSRMMDGYSRAADDAIASLRHVMETAPDEETRKEVQRLITKMEKM